MPVYHRTRRLQIYGDKPEVTTLFGNRYQMVVRCEAKHDTEAWYNANKSQIFADFGTLYDAEMAIDGIEPRTGEAYDNMVLVSNEASYTRTGEYIVTFVYQTLTADFVQEAADKVDYELNGLRRVTRPLIAKDGSDYYNLPDAMVVEGAGTAAANGVYLRNGDQNSKPAYLRVGGAQDDLILWDSIDEWWEIKFNQETQYVGEFDVATPDLVTAWIVEDGSTPVPTVRRATWADIEAAGIDPSTVPVLSGSEKVIGTSTISHTEHGYDTETLTLASAVEDAKGPNEGGYVRIVETWVEAGTLSVSTRLINDGVKQNTFTYLGVEGTPTGTIVGRRISNNDGLSTFEIDVLTDTDGESLTGAGGAAKLNFEYQQLVPFTFPGVVDLVRQQNHIFPSVRSPVEALVKADVLIYYQSSPDISASDFTLDGAIGIWNPSEWCQKISTIDSFVNDNGTVVPAYYNAQGIRGCRTREALTVTGNNGVEIRAYTGTFTPEILALEETTELENGKSIYRQVWNYVYDVTHTYFENASGVDIFRGPYGVKGTYTVECKWNGTNWNITYSDVISDPTRNDSNAGDLNYTYSSRTKAWATTYTNVSATSSGTLFSGSNGGNNPNDATWSGITVLPADNEETFTGLSTPASTGIPITGFWIEGRNVDNGASGQIAISGGPSNPLGKRYVLDVNIKKAFDDIDGNTTWMKQVVVADITPV